MKWFKYIVLPMFFGLMVVALSGCGGGSDSSPSTPTNPPEIDPQAKLVSIVVEPTAMNLPIGVDARVKATGVFDSGKTADITAIVPWSSNNEAVAVVNAGVVTTVAEGSAAITATWGDVSASIGVTVGANSGKPEDPEFSHIDLSFANGAKFASVPVNTTGQLMAKAVFRNNDSYDANRFVTFHSKDSNIVEVGPGGFVEAVNIGTTELYATYGEIKSNVVTVEVTYASLTAINISPKNMSLNVGESIQFKATGDFSNGQSADITHYVEWQSNSKSVVIEKGLAVAVESGSAVIVATAGVGLEDATEVNVIGMIADPEPEEPTLTGIAFSENPFGCTPTQSRFIDIYATYSDEKKENIESDPALRWDNGSNQFAELVRDGDAVMVNCGQEGTNHIRVFYSKDGKEVSNTLTVNVH
jgi:uncharacterized protein YjdB